jgi:hypothetical protein
MRVKRRPAAVRLCQRSIGEHDQLASAETGAEQRGTSLRTAVDARIDGGDVNLVTTSASGELQNHPEAQIKLPWVGRLQNFIPLTSQRTFRNLNPTHGGSAQTSFDILAPIPRA